MSRGKDLTRIYKIASDVLQTVTRPARLQVAPVLIEIEPCLILVVSE